MSPGARFGQDPLGEDPDPSSDASLSGWSGHSSDEDWSDSDEEDEDEDDEDEEDEDLLDDKVEETTTSTPGSVAAPKHLEASNPNWRRHLLRQKPWSKR